jgi:hypothetical protein
MIIQFEDKYKREVIIDIGEIAALCENISHSSDGTSSRKDGDWTVVMKGGQFYWEVSKGMKDTIQKVWEDNHA